MLIKYQNEILKRIAIFFTMLVEAFDCLSQYDAINLVWIMFFWSKGFCASNMKQKST